jgi:hypothetical protein
MRIVITLLFVLTAVMPTGSVGVENQQRGAADGNDSFTGRAIRIGDAIARADLVFVGELAELGSINPGPPGAARYVATVRIHDVLWEKALPPGREDAKSGQVLRVSYTVQSLPADAAETAPPRQTDLIFIVERQTSDPASIIKILPATKTNSDEVERALRAQ